MPTTLSPGFERDETSHALLCAAGHFARVCGLIEAVRQGLHVRMKTVAHTPQDKLLTFFLYILAGLHALPEADTGHHPLRKDPVLARAWAQAEFPYHTGVSLLLQRLTDEHVREVRAIIDQVSAPWIEQAVQEARAAGPLTILLDLTGEPVSDQSQSYPETAYGYMDGTMEKGYQLAVVSLCSPEQRTFLAGFHHPGNTVSAHCLRELSQASEAVLGAPSRRPELIERRIRPLEDRHARLLRLAQQQEAHRDAADERLAACRQRLHESEAEWLTREASQDPGHPVAPTGYWGRLRRQRASWLATSQRAQAQRERAHRLMEAHRAAAEELTRQITALRDYQAQLRDENQRNPNPRAILVVLDAGFGTAEQLTWLIEQGYEVDGKPHAPAVALALQRPLTREPHVQVNHNTWMIEIPGYEMAGCPYPLRWALCRQVQGPRVRYEAMCSYRAGARPSLRAWFRAYHQRADIEAGFKQSKGIFGLGTFHTRSLAGIKVQELLVLFACNFLTWFKHWLARHPTNAFLAHTGTQELVRVAGHTDATVTMNAMAWLIRFDDRGPYAGHRLYSSSHEAQPVAPIFGHLTFSSGKELGHLLALNFG